MGSPCDSRVPSPLATLLEQIKSHPCNTADNITALIMLAEFKGTALPLELEVAEPLRPRKYFRSREQKGFRPNKWAEDGATSFWVRHNVFAHLSLG